MNIENLARSAAIVIVGLPLTLALSASIGAEVDKMENERKEPTAAEKVQEEVRAATFRDCMNWVFSAGGDTLEKQSEVAIDKTMGGNIDHRNFCQWVLS